MSYQEDPELEARLRRVGTGPSFDPPRSLHAYLNAVAHDQLPGGTERLSPASVRPMRRGLSGTRQLGALAAIAAALVVAVAGASLLVAIRGPQGPAAWTMRANPGTGEWTGLEWHDITATAGGLARPNVWLSGTESGTGGVVKWRGGFAAIGGDVHLWLSPDGLTWKRAQGLPTYEGVPIVFRGDLYIVGYDSTLGWAVYRTSDGVTWTKVAAPFDLGSFGGFAAGDPGVVATTVASDSVLSAHLSALFFSADGAVWTEAKLPADLVGAGEVQVSPFIKGFVATGLVPDPNGKEGFSSNGGPMYHYSYRSWISPDGLTWAVYDPAMPAGLSSSSVPRWGQMQRGKLGAGDGVVYSTDGGATWLPDDDNFLSPCQTVSDGSHVVLAAESGARFYVSEGDGHWRQLELGGDVGSLPAEGAPLLLPDGVLWVSADRVYFGQGLAGVTPEGSLGPPTTPSPLPYTPVPAVETPIPAVATPSASPTPGMTMAATGFITPGTTSGWTGFTWSAIADSSPIRTPITGFLQWSGGYVAYAGTAPYQSSGPTRGLWTSPDGETWTAVRSIDAQAVFVSAAPGGLVAISVDPAEPYRPGAVWTSSDGISWSMKGPSNLPGTLMSIAGTSAGIVATVDLTGSTDGSSDSYAVMFSKDGFNWTQETPAGGVPSTIGPRPHVQSGNGRFFLTGMSGPVVGLAGDSPFVLDALTTADVTLWSDDGRTWTQSAGSYSGLAQQVLFGRDGLLLQTIYTSTPGGVGLARSSDGGKTWVPDDNFTPLGVSSSFGAGSAGPAGVIVTNGTAFLAVSDRGKASISYDGQSWTPISWAVPAPTQLGIGSATGLVMLPRGLFGAQYGAAH
jgi:hypothetical protein